jgi:putative nucleotidyltransferase with HDIG domain
MVSPSAQENQAVLPDPLRAALRARVDGELRLPLLSDIACRVMAICGDARANLDELAELVTHDQSLAVHILRVANSAAYAPRDSILSLQQAISRLGLSTVSDVAIAVALKERVFCVPGHDVRLRELWLHSATTACYAKEIARLMRRHPESAFLCGLLHDVGMPIVMQVVCDLAREHSGAPVPAPVMEAAMLEFHGEFGAKIAQRWRLGPWISSSILYHHDPTRVKMLRDEVLVTALADALADWAMDESQDEMGFVADQPLAQELNLSKDAVSSLLRQRHHVLKVALAFL